VGCCGADGSQDFINALKPVPMECRDLVTGVEYTYGCQQQLAWYDGDSLFLFIRFQRQSSSPPLLSFQVAGALVSILGGHRLLFLPDRRGRLVDQQEAETTHSRVQDALRILIATDV